jgi:hypothetical protein
MFKFYFLHHSFDKRILLSFFEVELTMILINDCTEFFLLFYYIHIYLKYLKNILSINCLQTETLQDYFLSFVNSNCEL